MGAGVDRRRYTVFAVNPLQAARYRDRLGVSGAKSDTADAHELADMVRTDSHQLRPVVGDSAEVEAVKVVTRMHKALIWERSRAGQRLRHALREYFPAALEAFEDLDAAETLELLAKAPDPARAGEVEHRADQRRPHTRPPLVGRKPGNLGLIMPLARASAVTLSGCRSSTRACARRSSVKLDR